MASEDCRSIFDPLKPNLTQTTAIVLEDIFKRILGDLGFTAGSFSVTAEGFLESISESILGKAPKGPLESGSVSRIAHFVASGIVDNVLDKLHSTTHALCSDLLSKNDLLAGWKEMGPAGPGKPTVPDAAFWSVQIHPSSELVAGVAEEIVQMINEKLELFASLSKIKLIQLKLLATTKAIDVSGEQLFAAIPPHSIQSEADACTNSNSICSLETNILQCVEEIISNVLSYIHKQTSQNGRLPPRESSILLHLVNDVFQSFSAEKLESLSPKNILPGVYFKRFSPPVQFRAGLNMQGGLPDYDTQPPAITTEKEMKKPPCSPISCPGMAILEEQEEEKTQASGTSSPITIDQKVLVMEETQGKAEYESLDPQSPQSREMFLGTGEKAEPKSLERMESGLENLDQDAIFSSLGNEQMVASPAGQIPGIGQATEATRCIIYQALKKMEDRFQEEELPLVEETVQKLLNENFERVWADQPTWPPASAPSSFAHLTINWHQQEKQPASQEHVQFNSQTPVSDSEVNTFASRLVKIIFQKLSFAVLADADSPSSKHSCLTITNVLPSEVAADAEKDLATAHSGDPEISLERETSEGGPQTSAEDLGKGDRPEIHRLPLKLSLANDLVQACLAEVQDFVTTKVEPRFCSRLQNLNSFTISDVSCTVDRDVKKASATVISQKPSSKFEKIFKALSRVFSRKPGRKRDKPAPDRQKPAKE